jgi:NAD(P)-dependent dehydrogenase (short-subunit alcohol dehydrogenase family)
MPMSECVALIVGAGTTAGQQIARELAADGFRVALNDLLPDRIETLASELGSQAVAHPADLSRKLSVQTMLQAILEKWERIDALVFVASIQPTDPILDMDEWDWHRTIDLNLTTAFLCMQSVGRVMRELGDGVIVNVLAGDLGIAAPAYEIAAAGLRALAESAKTEFAASKIKLHTVDASSEVGAQVAKICASALPAPASL